MLHLTNSMFTLRLQTLERVTRKKTLNVQFKKINVVDKHRW